MCKIEFKIEDLNKCILTLNAFDESKTQEAFWDDDYISKQLLDAHLNPEWDAASRKLSIIKTSSEWIVRGLNLDKYSKMLDLWCGPGLCCTELSKQHMKLTGIDFTKRSIDYAKKTGN